jgi:hypothetical protein
VRFKRGDIDTATYLGESGAMSEYLESQGVSMDALRATTGAKFEASWASATDEFLASPAGQDWPGGEENKNLLGRLIEESGLTGQPSAETLAAAWAHMKENNLTLDNPDNAYAREMSEAQSAAEIAAINARYFRGSGSGLFGR